MNFSGSIIPHTTCTNQALGFGSFFQVIQTLLSFAIYLSVFFAVLMIAYAGFLLVTSAANPSNREAAKTAILQAFIGLLVVLGAWLLVNTVLAAFGTGSFSSVGGATGIFSGGDPCVKQIAGNAPAAGTGSLAATGAPAGSNNCPGSLICSNGTCQPDPQVDNGDGSAGAACVQGSDNCASGLICDVTSVCTTPPGASASSIPASCNAPAASAVSGNEDQVRGELQSAGVSVNKSACPASAGNACGGTPPSCTDVGGMQAATVSQVITIANSCSGCGLVVTGGNEPGHACGTYSHGNGYKVDLRPSSGLDTLLEGLNYIGQRNGDGPGPAYTDSCGNQYVRESDHWDVTVKSACSL